MFLLGQPSSSVSSLQLSLNKDCLKYLHFLKKKRFFHPGFQLMISIICLCNCSQEWLQNTKKCRQDGCNLSLWLKHFTFIGILLCNSHVLWKVEGGGISASYNIIYFDKIKLPRSTCTKKTLSLLRNIFLGMIFMYFHWQKKGFQCFINKIMQKEIKKYVNYIKRVF